MKLNPDYKEYAEKVINDFSNKVFPFCIELQKELAETKVEIDGKEKTLIFFAAMSQLFVRAIFPFVSASPEAEKLLRETTNHLYEVGFYNLKNIDESKS